MLIKKYISLINTEKYLKSGGLSKILTKDKEISSNLFKEADEIWKEKEYTVATFDYEGWSANITFNRNEIKFDTIDIYQNSTNWADIQNKFQALNFFSQESIHAEHFQLEDEETFLLKNGVTIHFQKEKDQFTLNKICSPWSSYDEVRHAILRIHNSLKKDN